MKIVIDKDSIIKAFSVVLYTVSGGDYSDVKDAVKELLEKINYEPYEERPQDTLITEIIEELESRKDYGAEYAQAMEDVIVILKAKFGIGDVENEM